MEKYIAHIREDGTIQTCKEHCYNTATIASFLLKPIGLSNTGYLAGLLHDMGKFNDKFLDYIQTVSSGKEYKGPKVIHTFAGVSFILGKHHGSDAKPIEKLTAEIIALAIGSHHGLLDVYNEINDSNAFIHRIEKQPEYDRDAEKHFFEECISTREIEILFSESVKEVSLICSRIKGLCAKPEQRSKSDFYLGLLSRLVLSAIVEGDRRDTADFMCNEKHPYETEICWTDEISSLNGFLDSLPCETEIQKVRRRFSDECNKFSEEPEDVYCLNLPTGGGKTLSGLRYALAHANKYAKRRIFYVAPLLSILEQNSKVIKNALPNNADILLHYSNITEDQRVDENDDNELDSKELFQDSWENKIIITTLVQMLQTMFSGKMSSVRRFNALANSVIIFDEIQSLPIKVYSMFNMVVNFLSKCCGATVILCSATLPTFNNAEVYPMYVSTKQMISQTLLDETKSVFKRTNIKKWEKELNLGDVIDVVINQLSMDNSILVVCNKKDQARILFNSLKERLKETDITLFHLSAGMCPKHRKDTIRELFSALGKNDKLICISTQVIEAGIDISFSCVFRFAAGIDSIIQSAGRCNRNGNDSFPHDVFILQIEGERLCGLKEIEQSKSAVLNLLDVYKKNPNYFEEDLASETSIKYFYKILFNNMDGVQDFPNPKDESGPTLMSYLSSNDQIIAANGATHQGITEYNFRQSFFTAGKLFSVFDDNQTSILVPYNSEARDIIASLCTESSCFDNKIAKDLSRAKDYSVSIFNPSFERLQKQGAIRLTKKLEIPYLLENYYDDNTGVSSEEIICSSMLIL